MFILKGYQSVAFLSFYVLFCVKNNNNSSKISLPHSIQKNSLEEKPFFPPLRRAHPKEIISQTC